MKSLSPISFQLGNIFSDMNGTFFLLLVFVSPGSCVWIYVYASSYRLIIIERIQSYFTIERSVNSWFHMLANISPHMSNNIMVKHTVLSIGLCSPDTNYDFLFSHTIPCLHVYTRTHIARLKRMRMRCEKVRWTKWTFLSLWMCAICIVIQLNTHIW